MGRVDTEPALAGREEGHEQGTAPDHSSEVGRFEKKGAAQESLCEGGGRAELQQRGAGERNQGDDPSEL